MSTNSPVTEVERAALTILAQAHTTHPALHAWLVAIINDPAEARGLGHYLEDHPHPDQTTYAAQGYIWDDIPGALQERRAIPFDWRTHDGSMHVNDGRYVNAMDYAAWSLAAAVVTYRHDERPIGDQHYNLAGMGQPVAIVITSLAAAIAEYVQDIRGAEARRWAARASE